MLKKNTCCIDPLCRSWELALPFLLKHQHICEP